MKFSSGYCRRGLRIGFLSTLLIGLTVPAATSPTSGFATQTRLGYTTGDQWEPAITAGLSGDVRIAWMDSRNNPFWNTYYRSSSDGGASWSSETRLSTYVPGYSYIQPDGFSFPFGDYFEMAINNLGKTQVVWGEGLNYDTPGSIWYTNGK